MLSRLQDFPTSDVFVVKNTQSLKTGKAEFQLWERTKLIGFWRDEKYSYQIKILDEVNKKFGTAERQTCEIFSKL